MIYVIINKDDVVDVDFSMVVENSENTLRYNLDNTKAIVKFIGETPSFLDGFTQYSHQEILEIINNPANGWTINDII
tara:strand:+ start:362 stop:592 length:231 start_codon:yes stop_codon:yes gene_type:complete